MIFSFYNRVYLIIFSILLVFLSYRGEARQGLALLRQPIGAKGNALGNAYSGSVKDPSAILWNPAGLSYISGKNKFISIEDKIKEAEENFDDFEERFKEGKESEEPQRSNKREVQKVFEFQTFVTASQLSFDRQIGFVGVGFPIVFGSLGAGILGSRVTGIEGYNVSGTSTGNIDYGIYSIYLGYGIETGATRIGFNIVGIQEQLSDSQIYGGAIDLGVQFFASIFEAGATIQNIGGIVQKSVTESDQFTRLDTILRLSASVQIPQVSLRLYIGMTANLDNREDGSPSLNLGLSYGIFKYSYLLLGLSGTRPSVGLEFSFPDYVSLAYSLKPDALNEGLEHYLDLNLRF